jgi:putative pyruvate formate lyase activating enzyme
MKYCNLCPNNCNADRIENIGRCGVKQLKIAKYYLHKDEEPLISGKSGSGTVFFCGCSLKCVFCQNYEISRNQTGKEISAKELADIFKELEDMGADNINLVNPSHYVPEIIEALNIYLPKIPIVYNTHSYEKIETLQLIDKYINIYLPDIKFKDEKISNRYTGKNNYFDFASKAIGFMAEKPLIIENGLIKSGTIVRHLIMPLCTDDSLNILEWYSQYKDKTYLSLMSQYTPYGDIKNFPELNRKITKREYEKVSNKMFELDITNCFLQEKSSSDTKFIPKWDF